ncbi:putative receptor-like protein kinase [Senna tora]|uniref:Putative receptor-like protein kinase n=1 Tax=Senna tora TaxID=362788 RepID=A0A834SU98_9FABA|nr:putative receptor-like protein kinase [Senna tora]
MEEPLQISLFPLLLLLQSLLVLSLEYSVPDKYFINCGSKTNAGDNFVAESSIRFRFPKDSFTDAEDNKSSTAPPLYRTARIFPSSSTYKFGVDQRGYHLVRLHFYAFSSSRNLSATARFDVSVPGFWLLRNFTLEKYSNSARVEEFYLNIDNDSFQIDFRPLESHIAFVNAIELFRLPDNFISDDFTGDIHISSSVLHTSYRLNVGGPELNKTEDDELRRNWEEDDQYAINGIKYESSINLKYKGDDSSYVGLAATKFIGPDPVYRTARVMNSKSEMDTDLFNITWKLGVKRNTTYFVRAHFYDVTSTPVGILKFSLYTYNNMRQLIKSEFDQNAVPFPFYYDFVVDSDEWEIMNITVGPDKSSTIKNAFLNGLEVMEITNTRGPSSVKEPPNQSHLHLKQGLGFGALAVICILVGLILFRKFRKDEFGKTLDWSPLNAKGGGSSHGRRGSSHGSSIANLNLGLKISFQEIQSATNNFHRKRIIGKGGFGNVYKGNLKNGLKVAVKRCEPGSSGQGLPEFQAEIMVLSRIRHRHLVSLIGYCDERSEMILVYEYMEKGTLRDHLYNSNLPSLSWKQRLEICIGAARGLNYLHKGAAGGIIHRDVKSTNILLDENHIAKVADFGLSRTGSLDQQQPHVTTGVKGTFGYLDPEYFRSQQLTEKSDVYSFGVVLLEVLCARPAIAVDPAIPREQANLAEWGIFCKNKGTLEEIIDPTIKSQIDPKSLRRFCETVEKCVQDDGCERPAMGDVLWDLEYSLQLQRGARVRKVEDDSSSTASASLQLANVRRLPSLSSLDETDDMAILKIDESGSAVGSVFSQMKFDDDRAFGLFQIETRDSYTVQRI